MIVNAGLTELASIRQIANASRTVTRAQAFACWVRKFTFVPWMPNYD
jgi:hypothetical protein